MRKVKHESHEQKQWKAEVARAKANIVRTYSNWEKDCSWCGERSNVAVNNKNMLVCSSCGH